MTSPLKESIILEDGNDDEIDDPPEDEPIHLEETISVEEDIGAMSAHELTENIDKNIEEPQSKCNAIIVDEKTHSHVSSSSPPLTPPQKEISTLSMPLEKEEIETMISQGTLEKVSKGYYKMKADKLKNLKISADLTSTEKIMPIKIKPCPLSIKPKGNESSQLAPSPTISFLTSSTIESTATNSPITTSTPLAGSSFVQPTPSYIALMPVNQASGSTGVSSTLLALPMQQNVPGNYNPPLPTFVTLSPSNISNSTGLPQGSNKLPIVSGSSSNSVTQPLPQKPLHQAPITNQLGLPSSLQSSNSIEVKSISSSTNPPSGSVVSGTKRKPHFEHTKMKRPYKYAKPIRKRRKTSVKTKNFVSDFNSSDDDDLDTMTKSRVFGMELASMFFKKIGEPQRKDKSLLDKLHKAIFEDSLDLESEVESDESDVETAVSDITNNSSYKTVTCPGPGQFEAFIGPGQNSRLSIIKSPETKVIKNFMYEVYKVRVSSTGREANTNILIPIPEGHKFQVPKGGKEECIEFSHLPHEDPTAMNSVSPNFLEKLAATELKLRKYKDEIKALRCRYLELLQEYADRPQFSTISDLVGAAAKFLTEDQLVFFVMQLKAGAHNMQGIRYSVREKVLALSIYQRAPEVYKWFRRLFNLPSKRVLDQWLEDVGSQDPQLLKKLMYYVYVTYNFKAVNEACIP